MSAAVSEDQTAQVLPPDVDYKVIKTFLEFYNTLLQFVMYKLCGAQALD
jgi:hypothetical protein